MKILTELTLCFSQLDAEQLERLQSWSADGKPLLCHRSLWISGRKP